MQEQPSSKHTPMHNNTIIVFLVKAETSIFVINGNISAGTHTVNWNGFNSDGKPVSSGVYLYIIKNDSFSAMKKMILMK